MTSDEKRAGMMYIGDDGRTVYALNNRGDRVDVGEVAEHAASGCVVTLRGSIKSVVGTVRQVPRVETIADAEALFGRGAEVIGARGGVAECLAADAPPVVALGVGAPTPQPDGTHLVNVRVGPPVVDLAAENAALREALAASGELLAEAHAEVERLRGAK